jgi:Reverse transcriptase (RNA-dependent DNA polymerase)
MVGNVLSAYLNARMPLDNPDEILHMIIETDVADEIIRQDKSFSKFRMKNGNILVRLNKALYGCIESAKLWYEEIAITHKSNGCKTNLRDTCIFNKDIHGKQLTIIVYVDDLKMTCVDKSTILEMERILLKNFGQFRTTQGPIVLQP